ncbi:MAG: esterase-like activity of phytase family protein [Pseudomonadota bacterium]
MATKRVATSATLALLLAAPAIALELGDAPSIQSAEFLGETFLPLGLDVDGTRLLGLSGLARMGDSDTYVAISDDTDGPARFYTLTIDLADGRLDDGDVVVAGVTMLGGPDGDLPAGSFDLEGIALDPGAETLLVASEGRGNGPTDAHAPFVHRYALDGSFVGEFALPARYDQTAEGGWGVHDSGGFESLVYTADLGTLWLAVETALQQDGAKPTLDAPSRLRIMRWDTTDHLRPSLEAEYVYELSPRQGSTILASDEGGDRSMVDLLPLDDTSLLVLEREWIGGEPRTNTRPIALYEIDTADAEDVSKIDPLTGDEVLVEKRLVLDLDVLRQEGLVERIGSFEAMIFGPTLDDGRRTLILVEDNDDGVDTQIIAFAVELR